MFVMQHPHSRMPYTLTPDPKYARIINLISTPIRAYAYASARKIFGTEVYRFAVTANHAHMSGDNFAMDGTHAACGLLNGTCNPLSLRVS